ncbi:MAG TPA: hypothetical protein VLF39_03085 [Candidatus Saccharimonadales bacterium]|nr:hypothetical protein [Candidatus Saccharimonadales bacterium]
MNHETEPQPDDNQLIKVRIFMRQGALNMLESAASFNGTNKTQALQSAVEIDNYFRERMILGHRFLEVMPDGEICQINFLDLLKPPEDPTTTV